MKKCFVIFLVGVLMFGILAGCRSSGHITGETQIDTTLAVPFADIQWIRTTEADTEYLLFSPDGQLSYYCACGNPVDDSDLCTGYRYDSSTATVYLDYSEQTDASVTQITVKSFADDTLVLDFGGDIRTFETLAKADAPKADGLVQAEDGTALEFTSITFTADTITIDGTVYDPMEYKPEIFYYMFAKEGDYQEDTVYLFSQGQWPLLYYNGDVFTPSETHAQACAYYAQDGNFLWSVSIDDAAMEDFVTYPLTVTQTEINEMATMEDRLGAETLVFDDIQKFATLSKTSKDGMIYATVQLAFRDGVWYWRSERIDEKQEHWPEFVCKLPATLNEKILAVDRTIHP